MQNTLAAVLTIGIVLSIPFAVSLTAVATDDGPTLRVTEEYSAPMPPEPGDDYYDYE